MAEEGLGSYKLVFVASYLFYFLPPLCNFIFPFWIFSWYILLYTKISYLLLYGFLPTSFLTITSILGNFSSPPIRLTYRKHSVRCFLETYYGTPWLPKPMFCKGFQKKNYHACSIYFLVPIKRNPIMAIDFLEKRCCMYPSQISHCRRL